MVTITVYRGDRIVQELDLEGPEITIGRNLASQIVLPDEGKGVSRDHASLRQEAGRYVLYDRNSKIGTLVDGKKINRVALESGQEFVIGPYRLVFNLAEQSSSDVKATVAVPRPSPPPPPDAPAREGTARRVAASQTHSNRPAERSQEAVGARVTGAMAWVTGQPPTLLYSVGIVALVLLGAVLFWLFRPDAPAQDPPIALLTTTSTSTTTTSIEEPIVDPHAEAIVRAEEAIGAAEETLAKGRFAAAIGAFNRAVQEHLLPVLTADPSHDTALKLQLRASTGAQQARDALALSKAKPTGESTVEYGPNPIERLSGESEEAYGRENARANREWDDADRASQRNDYRGAHTGFSSLKKSLATRQSAWRDLDTRIANARKQWDAAQQRTIEEARVHERAAHAAGTAEPYDAAVKEYLEARRGFEAAAALEAPGVTKEIEDNLARRRHLAGEMVKMAQSYANRRRVQANRICQLIDQLLTSNERTGIDPEGVCKTF